MQQNLLGQTINPKTKQIEEVEVEDPEDNLGRDIDTTPNIPVESTAYWNELNAWEESCKAAKESFTYLLLDYNGTLTDQWIHVTAALERIWRGASESYGGSWGHSNYESNNLAELKEEIIEFYKDHLDRPYNRALADEWAIRGIKRENIKVFFTEQTRQFIIEKGGWDVVELVKELDAIPEKPYDKDFELLLKEYNDTKTAKETTNSRYWDTTDKLEKYTKRYTDEETDGDIVKNLYELKKKLKKDVAILELKENELRKKLVRGYE